MLISALFSLIIWVIIFVVAQFVFNNLVPFFTLTVFSFIFSIIATFSKAPYLNKPTIQLSIIELKLLNGTITVFERLLLFLINFLASVFHPTVLFLSAVISVLIIILL
jgi:hypothetical protein